MSTIIAFLSIDAPFSAIERDDGQIAVTWRFADARWVDLARAHGLPTRTAYSYTFNPQEMNSPLISAVTGAGW